MSFKIHWEKSHQAIALTQQIVTSMVCQAFPEQSLLSYEVISSGCANLNIKIILKDTSHLLRIYLRDPDAGYREKKIYELLKNDLPIPEIMFLGTHTDEQVTYHFAISQFREGILLRDLLLNYPEEVWQVVMIEIGECLAPLQKFLFSEAGFLGANLDVQTILKPDDLGKFVMNCLANQEVQKVLGSSMIHQLEVMFKGYHSYLDHNTPPCLVHGDFDPANILVHSLGDQWHVSAILDWEFAFAGSWLWDIANMLRYAHQMPPRYMQSFITGVQRSGVVLPKDWQITITLYNISSLLDLLVRHSVKSHPIMMQDISDLISQAVKFITSHPLIIH